MIGTNQNKAKIRNFAVLISVLIVATIALGLYLLSSFDRMVVESLKQLATDRTPLSLGTLVAGLKLLEAFLVLNLLTMVLIPILLTLIFLLALDIKEIRQRLAVIEQRGVKR